MAIYASQKTRPTGEISSEEETFCTDEDQADYDYKKIFALMKEFSKNADDNNAILSSVTDEEVTEIGEVIICHNNLYILNVFRNKRGRT